MVREVVRAGRERDEGREGVVRAGWEVMKAGREVVRAGRERVEGREGGGEGRERREVRAAVSATTFI